MRRYQLITLIVTVALTTALGPPLLSMYLAEQQAIRTEMQRAQAIAQVVLDRSDRAVDQMNAVIDQLRDQLGEQLRDNQSADPCSQPMLQLMWDLSLSMEFIKLAGAVDGSSLLCSSLGLHSPPLDLGPPDEVTLVNSTYIRLRAPLALSRDIPYISLAREGFVAMAHRNQAVDLVVDQAGTLLATFNPGNGEIRTQNGQVNPLWVQALQGARSSTFLDDGFVVAVRLSDRFTQTGSLVAIPMRYVEQGIRELSLRFLPYSLVAAMLLTLAFLYLARQQTSLAAQIRQGIRRQEFYLEYQPVVELGTGRWVGAEALLRWRRNNNRRVDPALFIPYAEQNGLISKLTLYVIRQLQSDLAVFLDKNPLMMVSVNLSPRDLQSAEVNAELSELVARNRVSAAQLMVEVTERMMVDPATARTQLQAIRDLGIKVAIDDFGTGYSSLSYLETMPFDCLKIDRLFVEAIATESATSRVVLHIIEMAAELGLNTVAEGVETPSQAEYLMAHGVRYAQGWLYSRSLPAAEFIRVYNAHHLQSEGTADT